MSTFSPTARHRPALLLASSVLVPVIFSAGAACAQQVASELPPVEVTKPGDENRTRARATADKSDSTVRRPSPNPAQRGTAAPGGTGAPGTTTASGAGTGTGAAASGGIVGTATTVITAQDIAHAPQQTLADIIATQTPGAQLTTLYGGFIGAKTSVDLRGFGAFATANTLVLINGRRLNDIDMARWTSPPSRATRSSGSRSRAAIPARCSMATTPSAA